MRPSDVTRAFFEGFWNDGRDHVFEELVAPEVMVRNRFAGEVFTRADLAALHGGLRRLFAGVRVTVDDVLESGDRVAAVLSVVGGVRRHLATEACIPSPPVHSFRHRASPDRFGRRTACGPAT